MLSPRLENVEPSYLCLKMNDAREYRYFGRLLDSLGAAKSGSSYISRSTNTQRLRSVAGSAVRKVSKPLMRFLDS